MNMTNLLILAMALHGQGAIKAPVNILQTAPIEPGNIVFIEDSNGLIEEGTVIERLDEKIIIEHNDGSIETVIDFDSANWD